MSEDIYMLKDKDVEYNAIWIDEDVVIWNGYYYAEVNDELTAAVDWYQKKCYEYSIRDFPNSLKRKFGDNWYKIIKG